MAYCGGIRKRAVHAASLTTHTPELIMARWLGQLHVCTSTALAPVHRNQTADERGG